LRNIMIEKQLPGLVRFLRELQPRAIVHCPLASPEAFWASKVVNVPSIALNTFAGPGALAGAVGWCFKSEKIVFDDLDQQLKRWQPNLDALQRLERSWGLTLRQGLPPCLGYIDGIAMGSLTITTTSEDLQDPMESELQDAYFETGTSFAFVGPLLDGAGHWKPLDSASEDGSHVVEQVRAARSSGRLVVLVSMGTVVTGNMPGWGWEGRPLDELGRPQGLTGCQLCQSAWAGAFDAFGSARSEDGALIVVALGPQADPLGDVVAPPNAICCAFLPQVDILRAGVDVFLTHGGQNSFTESLVNATPVVVCPGFSDQVVNASKAVALGVGLKVDRPLPEAGGEELASSNYRKDVAEALHAVVALPECKTAAAVQRKKLLAAGGVERATELILGVLPTPSPGSATVGGA